MQVRVADLIIIAVYLIVIVFLGIWVGRKNKSQEDYFLAGRKMPWFPVALSIMATMVSANTFIGGPGWAYGEGLRSFMNNSNLPLVFFLVSGIFLPFLYNLKVTSIYEYVGQRFGKASRLLTAIGFILMAVLLVSTMIYTPALFISKVAGWDIKIVLPVMIAIAIIYTLAGGIAAVIWTDAIQMIVLWGGMFAVLFIALRATGMGFGEAMTVANNAGKLNAIDPSLNMALNNGLWVTLIGVGVHHMQYFSTDQCQVQRVLTAKNMKSVKRSYLCTGLLINVAYFIFMLIGVLIFVVNGGAPYASANDVMIDFVNQYVPVGVWGIVMAAVLAAVMSSIDSLLNSATTVFVKDIYNPFFAKKEDKDNDAKGLKVARRWTIVFAVAILLVAYFGLVGSTKSIIEMMASYTSYFCGSMFAVFFLAMFTKKSNDIGSAVGFIAGIIATGLVGNFTSVNWGWWNPLGFIVAAGVGYVVSILTGGEKKDITRLTYKGMRKYMMAEGQEKEDGVYIIPGKFDKSSYILLAVFVLQYVILLALPHFFG